MATEASSSPVRFIKRGLRKLAGPIRDESFQRTVFRFRRNLTPIPDDTLRHLLDKLIASPPKVLLVHSSLGACGRFTAGPESVLDALSAHTDTLVLVTHSYCYPEPVGGLGSVFDPRITPSCNGVLTNLFRLRPGACRSIHATHSLAAKGSRAAAVTADHYRWDTPTGPGTPYCRLVSLQSAALMFGVSFQYYTLFHTAEFDSGSPHAFQHGVTDRLRVIDENGTVRECLSKRQNWAPMRFDQAGELMESKGLVRRVKLGREFLRYVPDTTKTHDFLVERLRKIPDFLRQSCKIDLY